MTFAVGMGVRKALEDANDEARSDEITQIGDPLVTLTYGRDALYVYYREDNETRRLPFE
jgi:hypothetical protein